MKIIRVRDPKRGRFQDEVLYESLIRYDIEREMARIRKNDPDNLWDYKVTDIHTRIIDSYEM